MTAAERLVRRASERGVTTLTLDSPHNRNALSVRLVQELYDALDAAAKDPEIRAVVLTHTGGTFCAGADLGEATAAAPPAAPAPGSAGSGPAASGPAASEDTTPQSPSQSPASQSQASQSPASHSSASQSPTGEAAPGGPKSPGGSGASAPLGLARLLRTIVELPKPVVARVTGHVRAGGLGLLGACDIAVAGPGASFAFTEARLGLAPAVISMPLLPRLDPRAASRYYLTGERFDAVEAARIGLVTVAAGSDREVDEALAPVLDGLRRASPQGLAESKRLVTAEVLRGFDRDTDALAEQSARLFASDEAREGMTAFLERRDPAWAR
ncbi:enoyl-CoA hydratase family protein [Streptomyces sp. bgisy100]|uniref:enoyl-CoA hydratase family protein n=1 Tax=Streptomyces sp. bgisy100 TaxID=3413783 RepID=UPI003D713274